MITPSPIRIDNLTLTHDRHPAVHHLSGVFAPGSLTAVIGPNGGGKTTLLRAIAGLHRPDEGTIDRGALRASDIALLPQSSALDRDFPIACLDVVALGGWSRIGAFRAPSRAERAAAASALRAVGLDGFESRPIGSLSAGQFQRVLFARLMAQDAPVILLDEPFNAMDQRTEADLLALVRRWHAEGRTLIAVLHDLALVRAAFPNALLLAREPVAWGPTGQALSPAARRQARLAVESWADEPEICRPAA